MRHHRAISFLLPVLLLAASAPAARLETGTTYTLPARETLVNDVYFGGSILRIEGRLDGSVAAGFQSGSVSGQVGRNAFLAGQNLDVPGTVGGDLVAFGATVNVTGEVGGALRCGAGTVYLNGRVGRDVLAACQSLNVGRNAEVKGDLLAGAGVLTIDGIVRGDVRAGAGEVVIAGQVDGDVDVTVGEKLTIGDDARIFGKLRYHAARELNIGNRDAVFGEIEYVRRPEPERLRVSRPGPGLLTAVFLPLTIYSVFAALAVGFILVAVWKSRLDEAVDTCARRFGYAVGFGTLGFFATPVAVLLGLLLIVTIPAGLMVGAAYLFAVYLAKILTGMFVGRLLFRLIGSPGASLWAAAPVGIVITYALCAIPIAGWACWLMAQILGFGLLVELIAQTRRVRAVRF